MWPPELVGIAVQDPIRTVLDRREPGHAGHPLSLSGDLSVLADHAHVTVAHVALEDVARAVDGAVIGDDDEIDAGVQMECQLRVEDVLLITNDHRQHNLHACCQPTSDGSDG